MPGNGFAPAVVFAPFADQAVANLDDIRHVRHNFRDLHHDCFGFLVGHVPQLRNHLGLESLAGVIGLLQQSARVVNVDAVFRMVFP